MRIQVREGEMKEGYRCKMWEMREGPGARGGDVERVQVREGDREGTGARWGRCEEGPGARGGDAGREQVQDGGDVRRVQV